MKKVLSIDIGGTYVKWAIIDKSYAMLYENKFASKPEYRDLLLDLRALIEKYSKDVEAVSITIPGGYDNTKEQIFAPNLLTLNGKDIRKDLAYVFSKTILIENDANLAALGEYYLVEKCAIDSMIFITLGTGVGGGAIIKGELLSSYATTFEIGHMVVLEGNRRCGCGRYGCLDEYCSSSGLEYLYNEMVGRLDVKITPEELGRLAGEGDGMALKTFKRYAEILASGICNIANLFAPDKIKIGGGISELARYYLDEVKFLVDRDIFPLYKGRVKIEVAELKNTAGVLGAAVRYFAKL